MGVFLNRFLIGGSENSELIEGIAEFLIDEVENQRIYRYHSAQINLNPPIVKRILGVGFPIRHGVVVENISCIVAIRTDATDTGAEKIGVDRIILVVQDNLTFDIERFSAVDIQVCGLFALAAKVGDRTGKGVQIVENIKALAEKMRFDCTSGSDIHCMGGQLPIFPVSRRVDHYGASGDSVALLGLAGNSECECGT